MTSRDFAYWLQGFFELQPAEWDKNKVLTAAQVDTIRRHLSLVFKHEIDPSAGGPEHQAELSAAHDGAPLDVPHDPAPPKMGECVHGRPSFTGTCMHDTRIRC